MFKVGQKVVCIKDSPWKSCTLGEITPQLGCIYTIRSINPGSINLGKIFLRFDEIKNKHFRYSDGFGEAQFISSSFRPVVERKTDISIFTSMLTPNNAPADVLSL